MSKTLKSIIDSYRAGLLTTPNIQVVEKKLSDEIIEFPRESMYYILAYACFKNSDLINMKFINVDFESCYFEKCLIENCIFEDAHFALGEFDNCMFTNCQFIHCNFNEADSIETVFNECSFVRSIFANAVFNSCHFLKSIFEDMGGGNLGSAVVIDSKFSNSKKSLEFKGEVYFQDIFDQIHKL